MEVRFVGDDAARGGWIGSSVYRPSRRKLCVAFSGGSTAWLTRARLRSAARDVGEDAFLAGRDTVLGGDPKQANPIGDDPMYKEGAYTGQGQNKPRGSDRTPSDAWSTHKLVNMGMAVRNSFDDVVLLRQVHRYVDEKAGIPPGHLCTYCIGGAYPFPDQVAGAAAKATAQLELLEIRQG